MIPPIIGNESIIIINVLAILLSPFSNQKPILLPIQPTEHKSLINFYFFSIFDTIIPVQMTISNARKNALPMTPAPSYDNPLNISIKNARNIHSAITTPIPINMYFPIFFI